MLFTKVKYYAHKFVLERRLLAGSACTCKGVALDVVQHDFHPLSLGDRASETILENDWG